MEIYTLTKDSSVLGEKDPTYGFSYWTNVAEVDLPVMFSTNDVSFVQGQKITFESSERKTSAKGNEYLRLKKVKKVSGASGSQGETSSQEQPAKTTQGAQPAAGTLLVDDGEINLYKLTRENNDMLKKILEYVTPQIDKVVDVDPEETIDLNAIDSVFPNG